MAKLEIVAHDTSDGLICADAGCVEFYETTRPLLADEFKARLEAQWIRCRSCDEMIRPDIQGWDSTYAASMGVKP